MRAKSRSFRSAVVQVTKPPRPPRPPTRTRAPSHALQGLLKDEARAKCAVRTGLCAGKYERALKRCGEGNRLIGYFQRILVARYASSERKQLIPVEAYAFYSTRNGLKAPE
eukprot:scaffold1140_cov251-Pinguiococcus_pyrenoidosus.AAC.7